MQEAQPVRIARRADLVYAHSIGDDEMTPEKIYARDGVCKALEKARRDGLTRFGGAAYEESLKRHLMEKYRDRPIGAVVAIGKATLEHALRWRAELWPGVPIVFAMLDETDLARIGRPADVTGVLIRNSLTNAVSCG